MTRGAGPDPFRYGKKKKGTALTPETSVHYCLGAISKSGKYQWKNEIIAISTY